MTEINVVANLNRVQQRLRNAERDAGRSEGCVALLAVSKTKPVSLIRQLAAAGQQAFGENYAQEAIDKAQQLAELPLEWHFIGPIQSNKTKGLATHMDWIHSIDRLKIARRLSEQRSPERSPLQVCLQVNVSGEASKSGIPPTQLTELAHEVAALPNLVLRGLMAIPDKASSSRQDTGPFDELRELLETLRRDWQGSPPPLDTLSMGMSADLEAAVMAGSTVVRVGTDVFGAR